MTEEVRELTGLLCAMLAAGFFGVAWEIQRATKKANDEQKKIKPTE